MQTVSAESADIDFVSSPEEETSPDVEFTEETIDDTQGSESASDNTESASDISLSTEDGLFFPQKRIPFLPPAILPFRQMMI